LSQVAVETSPPGAAKGRPRASQPQTARTILLDCDGVPRGEQVVVPAAEAPTEDVRQFGQLALRLITGGPDLAALGPIVPDLIDLVRRSLAPGTGPRAPPPPAPPPSPRRSRRTRNRPGSTA